MSGKRNTKIWKARKKAVRAAPAYLKTVMIAKPRATPRVKGTFGAASEVVRIDPKTGLPIEAA